MRIKSMPVISEDFSAFLKNLAGFLF